MRAEEATLEVSGSGSYRESHKRKGSDYQGMFSNQPHCAMLWTLEKRVLDEILATRFRDRPPRYLDFACGTGRIIGHLGRRTKEPTGVDVSISMLEVARASAPFAVLIEADITRNDLLGDRKFDLITAFRFFPNAEPSLRREAMGALVRHLEPGGYVVFNNHLNDTASVRRIVRALGREPGGHSMHPLEVAELASAAGLRIEQEYALGSLPFTDRHMPLPGWLLGRIERVLSLVPGISAMAQDIIYLCTRADPPEGGDV